MKTLNACSTLAEPSQMAEQLNQASQDNLYQLLHNYTQVWKE